MSVCVYGVHEFNGIDYHNWEILNLCVYHKFKK